MAYSRRISLSLIWSVTQWPGLKLTPQGQDLDLESFRIEVFGAGMLLYLFYTLYGPVFEISIDLCMLTITSRCVI